MLWTEPNNAEKLVKVLAALGIDTVERITNVNNRNAVHALFS